jgi:hypothetical protein
VLLVRPVKAAVFAPTSTVGLAAAPFNVKE